MARMNDQDRSLKIIARQNGWDPNEIIGDIHDKPEDRVKVGDSRTIPASMADQAPSPPGKDTPATIQDDPPLKSHKTTGADPYAGMGNF